MTEETVVKVTIHLSSGEQTSAVITSDLPEDVELDELAQGLLDHLLNLERPQFVRFDNVIVHTQAISALVLDTV